MRKFKVLFLSMLVASFFLTSCQKEEKDQNFEQNIAEQSEEIADNREDLMKEKVAPELPEKQLATSGMSYQVENLEPDAMPEGAISRSPSWINCGQEIYSSTHGAPDDFDGHDYLNGCLDKYYAFNAPDKEYFFNVSAPMSITFELTHLNKDLDLFIFSSNWQQCYGYSVNPYQNSESITLHFNPGTYVVVIDGYKASMISQFKLTMTCEDGCEDFDNYHNGNISSQSFDWSKWVPGATFDGKVTSNRSFSPHKSLYIDHKPGYSDANQMDVVKKIGEYSSGRYFISWKMYVPHNRNAAFNFQKYNLPGLETGLVVYLRKGKGIALRANNQIYHSSKSYGQGQWINISVDYDLNAKIAVLSVDNKLIAAWNTRTRNNTPANGVNRLGGIDFWAYHDYTTFYVDDICVEDYTGISILYNFDPETIFIDLI